MIKLNEDEEQLIIGDINEDMSQVSAQIAYWGRMWAEAEAEKEVADARYRAWRAKFTKRVLEEGEKLPEWKVKNMIESSKQFLAFKEEYAEAVRNSVMLRAKTDACKAKASLLQSKGAMLRAEFEATGMATRSEKKKAVEAVRIESKKERLKAARRRKVKAE